MTQQLENVSKFIRSNNAKQGTGYLVRDLGFSDPVITEIQTLILSRPKYLTENERLDAQN